MSAPMTAEWLAEWDHLLATPPTSPEEPGPFDCPAGCDGGLIEVRSMAVDGDLVTVTCPVCKGTGDAA